MVTLKRVAPGPVEKVVFYVNGRETRACKEHSKLSLNEYLLSHTRWKVCYMLLSLRYRAPIDAQPEMHYLNL